MEVIALMCMQLRFPKHLNQSQLSCNFSQDQQVTHEQCLQFTHHIILPWISFRSKMLFLSSVTSSIVKFLRPSNNKLF